MTSRVMMRYSWFTAPISRASEGMPRRRISVGALPGAPMRLKGRPYSSENSSGCAAWALVIMIDAATNEAIFTAVLHGVTRTPRGRAFCAAAMYRETMVNGRSENRKVRSIPGATVGLPTVLRPLHASEFSGSTSDMLHETRIETREKG